MGIMGNNGLINKILMAIGYGPVQLLYNKLAVIVVSVYISLPYAILPLYSSIEKFDFGLIDAAKRFRG